MSIKIVIECDGGGCCNSIDFDVEQDDTIQEAVDGCGYFELFNMLYCSECAPIVMEENGIDNG